MSARAAGSASTIRGRLRRVQGQIGGAVRMIEDGRECEDVVTQLMAARAALDRVAALLVSTRVEECLSTMSKQRASAAVRDAITLLGRFS